MVSTFPLFFLVAPFSFLISQLPLPFLSLLPISLPAGLSSVLVSHPTPHLLSSNVKMREALSSYRTDEFLCFLPACSAFRPTEPLEEGGCPLLHAQQEAVPYFFIPAELTPRLREQWLSAFSYLDAGTQPSFFILFSCLMFSSYTSVAGKILQLWEDLLVNQPTCRPDSKLLQTFGSRHCERC